MIKQIYVTKCFFDNYTTLLSLQSNILYFFFKTEYDIDIVYINFKKHRAYVHFTLDFVSNFHA